MPPTQATSGPRRRGFLSRGAPRRRAGAPGGRRRNPRRGCDLTPGGVEKTARGDAGDHPVIRRESRLPARPGDGDEDRHADRAGRDEPRQRRPVAGNGDEAGGGEQPALAPAAPRNRRRAGCRAGRGGGARRPPSAAARAGRARAAGPRACARTAAASRRSGEPSRRDRRPARSPPLRWERARGAPAGRRPIPSPPWPARPASSAGAPRAIRRSGPVGETTDRPKGASAATTGTAASEVPTG